MKATLIALSFATVFAAGLAQAESRVVRSQGAVTMTFPGADLNDPADRQQMLATVRHEAKFACRGESAAPFVVACRETFIEAALAAARPELRDALIAEMERRDTVQLAETR
jgi:hypothetical protein